MIRADANSSNRAFRYDIQGLRGLAVLVVVLFHAGVPIPGGFVGVDVFFVISGYVITALLLRELRKNNQISFRLFYERRVRRLVPSLTLVLLVTLVLTFFLGSPFDDQQVITAQTAIGAVTLSANAVIFLRSGEYFATPPTNNPLLNTWSLSVEEQFYLVFPLIVLLLWVVGRKLFHRHSQELVLIAGLITIAGASFVLSIGMSFTHVDFRLTDPDWFAFYSSPTRAWEFAVGGIAYLVFRHGVNKFASFLLFWFGLIGIIMSCFVISTAMVFPGWISLLPVISTAAVLVGGVNKPKGEFVVSNRGMNVLGDASYSWYLWHWPLIAFAIMLIPDVRYVALIAALISLPIALVTTKYLERPIRFSLRITRAQTWSMFGISTAVVIGVGFLLSVGSQNGWGNASIQSMERQVSAEHLWMTSGCNSAIPLQLRGPECQWNSDGGGEPIYLLGDSLAGSLSEGILGAGQALDRPVFAGTQGACPFVSNGVFIRGASEVDCTTFVQETLNWLEEQPTGDVVLSSSLGYLEMNDLGLSFPIVADPVFTKESKTNNYIEGLSYTVRSLVNAGHRVSVVLPPPGFPDTLSGSNSWFPSQCNTLQALRDISGCGATRSESEVVSETANIFSELSDAVESAGGRVIDYRSYVCVDSMCSTNEGNSWKYLDGTHISVGFSQSLAPAFTTELDR